MTDRPLEPLRAAAAIGEAFDRDQVLALLVRAAKSRLSYVTLLLVEPDQLRGWRDPIELPRTVPALEAAIDDASPRLAPLETGESFVDGMLEQLGGRAPAVALLPVCLRMRPIALLVGHRGDAMLGPEDIADLFPLLDATDAALARMLSTRARTAAERAPTRHDTEYDVELSFEHDRRTQLAEQRAAENWAGAAETIRELIRDGVDTGDPGEDEQLELLVELGAIEAERLGRPEAAIDAWRSAQTIDGSDERVLDSLEALLAKLGRWFECAELVEKRAALAESEGPRIAALLNLAAMAREHLNDPGRAIEAYERVLALSPAHPFASAQLEELYRARREWEPLAAQLLDKASRDPDPGASIAALVEVAEMYERQVGDARAAALVWLTVLRRAPERPGILDELARLAPAAGTWEEICAEAAGTAAVLDGPIAAELWQLVGRWSRDHLGDRDRAVRAFEAALRIAPDDPAIHEALGELHEAMPPLAIEYYARAAALEPDAIGPLVALHRLYRAGGKWQELADLVPRLVDALAPSAQADAVVELYAELGEVLARHLGRPEDAIAAYQDALALDPKHAEALAAIADLYAQTGQAEALLEVTEAEIDAVPAAVKASRYADVAAAWHEHGRYDRAGAVWRKLLAVSPSSAVAQQGLARTLRADGQWLDLVAALRAQILLAPGAYDRLVLLELADVLETRLDDVSGATAALEEITAREPDDPPALDALARLHERAGRLRPALDALDRLLVRTEDPRARADLLARTGSVHLAARDTPAARLALSSAIALDRENPRTREAMARVHLQQGELVAAGEELLRAARLSSAREDRLRCLLDAAWLYRYRLGDNERARECLHQLLELDPDHADAKHAMAELLHDNQEWAELWPHLEAEAARAPRDPEVLAKAARCAVELGKTKRALELYDAACSLAPSAALSIERAEALYRGKQLDAAALAFQTVATDAAALERAQRIAVFRRLAQINTELGKGAQAQVWHGKLLDLDPTNRDALTELAELHLAAGRHDDAVATLRALADASQGEARAALLERIGDLYRHQLGNPARAASTYLDALELDRSNRRVLQRLLDLQSSTGQWTRAVETIGRFLEHETDHGKRAAYHLAAAEIRRTELRDPRGALGDYDRALDELLAERPVPEAARKRALYVFHQIDTIVTEERDWPYLEQAYLRMIRRMPAGDTVLVALWHALGEVYRSRLVDYQKAAAAFEAAHALDADKAPMRSKILAELYARLGAARPETTRAAAAKLAEVDPDSSGAYRLLASSSLQAKRIDEAWCAARALVVLKRATFEEELLYKRYQRLETKKASGVLDEQSWGSVRHPDEDRAISALFSIVWEPLAMLRAGTVKGFELRPKDRMPIETDTRVVAKIFRHAARVLAVPLPDVYTQPRRKGTLMLAPVIEKGALAPALIIGRDLMTGYRDTEIAALVGSTLSLMRPAYYLKLVMQSVEELEAAVAAAARLCGVAIGRTELAPLVDVFTPALQQRLTPAAVATLRALVERLPAPLDLATWRTAVDAASQRAGLLVAGDLAASARMTPPRRVKDLVAYSVSQPYFDVRRHLGVTVA